MKEIADVLGINVSTLRKWKKDYVALNDALRAGARELVFEIKASLLKQALGYKEKEIKIIKKGDEIINTVIVERYYPPNDRACAMLLRNYDRDYIEKGKDVNVSELSDMLNEDNVTKIIDDISTSLEKLEGEKDNDENR